MVVVFHHIGSPRKRTISQKERKMKERRRTSWADSGGGSMRAGGDVFAAGCGAGVWGAASGAPVLPSLRRRTADMAAFSSVETHASACKSRHGPLRLYGDSAGARDKVHALYYVSRYSTYVCTWDIKYVLP